MLLFLVVIIEISTKNILWNPSYSCRCVQLGGVSARPLAIIVVFSNVSCTKHFFWTSKCTRCISEVFCAVDKQLSFTKESKKQKGSQCMRKVHILAVNRLFYTFHSMHYDSVVTVWSTNANTSLELLLYFIPKILNVSVRHQVVRSYIKRLSNPSINFCT